MLTIMIRRMEEMRRGGGAVEDQAWQIREQIGWFIQKQIQYVQNR